MLRTAVMFAAGVVVGAAVATRASTRRRATLARGPVAALSNPPADAADLVRSCCAEDDTLDVLYDDGDFESHVPRERAHAVSIELTDAFHAFAVGDVVKADLKGHGSWYTGRIIAIDTKFRVFTIKYENGHLEKHVPPSRVQPMSTGHIKSDYVHGERVRANWQSCGTWCLGRICAVNHVEGTFNVQYDDGEVEVHVASHSLQPAEDAEYKAAEAEPLPFACTLVSKSSGFGSGSSSAAAAAATTRGR